ncbi:tRNA uridine-5-carboxymethylaminomethyl(34) synthesis GTPase MnmE [Rhodovulum sp. DZ06]|uniref:tRNA uridine-5-carboxymethylaminomethyl(34) synthesis GTPase MnmE n=1 Tax=Rhodovulum sp. DZ06 TaxID=3425126 RepID=UPI003D341027
MTDTIYAPATAPGVSAVAVIRISGPGADAALAALCGTLPAPRKTGLRRLRDADGAVLDEALVIRFEDGASFTGEASAEIQCHGGRAVVSAIQSALSAQGLRLAEPGEFTRRAMEAGRMDLSEVEGLADLVASETDAQRRQALAQMGGGLTRDVETWRRDLIRARALVEAVIDFADEEVPEDVGPEVQGLVSGVIGSLETALKGARAAERVRDGFEVALIGPPNAGKSTLLNALAGREAAITSEIAGTTRDVIEVAMDIDGLAVTVLDTAGLRDTADPVEAIGVDRARKRAEAADIRVLLDPWGDADRGLLRDGDVILRSRADETGATGPDALSARTGQGVSALLDRIGAELQTRVAGASALTRARHVEAVRAAHTHLEKAVGALSRGEDALDIAAEDLRAATHRLEALIGRVDAERVLDDIFSTFCLGK